MLRMLKHTVVGFFALLVVGSQTLFAAEPMTDARAADTVAIQQLIVKYAHAYDSLDVEGYVGVFAEDAVFSFTGNALNGREEIREFISGAKARRDSAPAADPVINTYHSITNTLITLDSDTTAHQRSYWQVLTGPAGGPFTSNVGYYDDTLTKQNGQWLIQTRNIPQ